MSKRVLFVDDEPNITSAMKHLLRKEKYDILSATSAGEALGMLEKQPVDVIVSDERMPGMPGSQFLMGVKQKYPETILMLLTGNASSEAAARAVNEVDVYRFLNKPCNGLDLLINIRRAIQYKELLQRVRLLLRVSTEQTKLLHDIQKDHPDILGKYLNNTPKIMADSPPDDFQALLANIDNELNKSGKFISLKEDYLCRDTRENKSGSEEIQKYFPRQSIEQEDPSGRTPMPETTTNPGGKYASPMKNRLVTNPALAEESRSNDELENIENLNDIKPIINRSEIYDLLDNGCELKAMSSTVAQILKITQNPRCSIDNVARVVKQDHAVSLKILKLANSTVYSRGEPVDTVNKAIMRIGLTQIRQVVLNISVINQFNNEETGMRIRIPQFWEHSIATGLISAEIVRRLGKKEPEIEVAFTRGLLHDVGRLVYADLLGDKYCDILKMAEQLQIPLEQVESQMLLVNHADAIDRVLHKWNFPDDLIHPIALHQLSISDIRQVTDRSLDKTAPLALANCLAHALFLGTSGNMTLYPTEDFAYALRLKPEFFKYVEEKIPGQTDDIKFTMLAYSEQNDWPRLSDEVASRLHDSFRPVYLSLQPEFDALKIFCGRLTKNQEEESPNIGIIHIHSGRERVPLTTRFKDLEIEAGSVRLPLIIFSPKGDIMLEDRFMQNRSYKLLPFPVSISSIVDSFNSLVPLCESASV